MPFCNEPGLRAKLCRAMYWHQDLMRAMLDAARADPALAPLVRSHLRGVRYGIARQTQQYVERLGALCAQQDVSVPSKGLDVLGVSVDGLFRWLQAYCRVWMLGFEVRNLCAESVSAEFLRLLQMQHARVRSCLRRAALAVLREHGSTLAAPLTHALLAARALCTSRQFALLLFAATL